MGIPLKAARKDDRTLHTPKIITGSPDTTIEKKKAARLFDIVKTCPIPYCKPPMGRIVSSSLTVFINSVGAARLFDRVLCNSAAIPGTEPPGGFHPPAGGYRARREDHYHELMEVEHEASAFDEEKAYDREKYDGKRDRPQIPVGVPPGGTGGKRGQLKQVAGKSGSEMIRMGQGPGGSALGPPADRGDGIREEVEKEKERKEKEIDIAFPIDLRFGFRAGIPSPAPAVNIIIQGASSVYIG